MKGDFVELARGVASEFDASELAFEGELCHGQPAISHVSCWRDPERRASRAHRSEELADKSESEDAELREDLVRDQAEDLGWEVREAERSSSTDLRCQGDRVRRGR